MRREPQTIGNILAELMARHGFARVQSAERYEAAWREAAGELAAEYTRVGPLRRGKLEIIVSNSTLVQEFMFQKAELLAKLRQRLPDEGIQDLRFKVGGIS